MLSSHQVILSLLSKQKKTLMKDLNNSSCVYKDNITDHTNILVNLQRELTHPKCTLNLHLICIK